MKGLIKKDLLNLASYKTTLLILIIFCGIGVIGSSVNIAPLVICTIIGMISLSTFNYDEIAKSNKFILALPLTRKEVVLAKYILAITGIILGGILGIVLTLLVVNIMNIIRPNDLLSINYQSLFINALSGMFGISLIQAIQIPSIYKFGAEKGRIQMFVIIFLVIILIAGAGFLITNLGLNINTQEITNFLNKYGIIILIISMILMYTISYKISSKIFLKKDF